MMIKKTAAAFFVGALIAGSAQAAQSPIIVGTMDYLCPGTDGSLLFYYPDWPFSSPPAPGCIGFVNSVPYSSGNTYSGSASSSFSSGSSFSNAVPEPQTLAIFLAGLGLIALMAGRKKST